MEKVTTALHRLSPPHTHNPGLPRRDGAAFKNDPLLGFGEGSPSVPAAGMEGQNPSLGGWSPIQPRSPLLASAGGYKEWEKSPHYKLLKVCGPIASSTKVLNYTERYRPFKDSGQHPQQTSDPLEAECGVRCGSGCTVTRTCVYMCLPLCGHKDPSDEDTGLTLSFVFVVIVDNRYDDDDDTACDDECDDDDDVDDDERHTDEGRLKKEEVLSVADKLNPIKIWWGVGARLGTQLGPPACQAGTQPARQSGKWPAPSPSPPVKQSTSREANQLQCTQYTQYTQQQQQPGRQAAKPANQAAKQLARQAASPDSQPLHPETFTLSSAISGSIQYVCVSVQKPEGELDGDDSFGTGRMVEVLKHLGRLGVVYLAQGNFSTQMGKTGIEPPTFWLEDDQSAVMTEGWFRSGE
ncbi:unnamed protein product [Pleuronectes platessa]|uniref:Uncharacterized protein n=1 Tax=Pleuronectes platessa TaxID=8262 RepID=A0A9N7Z4R3_PLEPL|nr:unnamed protein product [Pleuronectes platessa]